MISHCKQHYLLKVAGRIMRTGEWPHMTAMCPKRTRIQDLYQSISDFSKLMQVVFDMKAEMGCMRRAMTNAGITFEKYPNGPRPREQSANGKQMNKFAGAAKTKNKANRIAQHSLATVLNRNEFSDSEDKPQTEYGGMATIMKKPKRHVSPRAMNAMLVGITKRRDPDM